MAARTPLVAAGLLCAALTGAQAQVPLAVRFGQTPQEQLGLGVENLGDLDQDGADEIAVRRWRMQPGGLVRTEWAVFSSRDLSLRLVLSDPLANAGGLRPVGDVDLDGTPDVAVGFPRYDVGPWVDAGLLRVYSGATGVPLLAIAGDQSHTVLTFPITGATLWRPGIADAGDLDQDGVADVAVADLDPASDPLAVGLGRVRVFAGAGGQVLSQVAGTLGEAIGFIGEYVDADGDGADELLLSIAVDAGPDRIAVWSASKNAVFTAMNDHVTAMRTVGDVTGDGLPEVAVGEGDAVGPVSLSLLDVFAKKTLWTRSNGWIGRLIGVSRDVDLDGVPDVPASVESAAATASQEVRVVSALQGATIYAADGWQSGDEPGPSALVTDLVGDGRAELVVGAHGDDPPGVGGTEQRGSVTLFADALGCGSIQAYGPPCPGSSPTGPTLALEGCPGSPYPLTLSWKDTLPGAAGLLLLGVQKASQPVLGCTLLVSPVVAALPWPTGAGAGEVAVLPTVNQPNVTFTVQLFVFDPAGPQGVAATNGVEVHFP